MAPRLDPLAEGAGTATILVAVTVITDGGGATTLVEVTAEGVKVAPGGVTDMVIVTATELTAVL